MTDVLLLNQYFTPDTAVTGRHAATIAQRLVASGLSVHALVGQPSYEPGQARASGHERRPGLVVERLPLPAAGRGTMPARTAGYVAYLAGALRRVQRLQPRLVLSFHNPPLIGLVARRVARRAGAPLVFVPQDIHPDIVVATGFRRLPGPVVAGWAAMNRSVYDAASRNIVLGDGMRQTLIDKGVAPGRVVTIPLWAEPELPELPADRSWADEHGLDDRPVLVYAGNLGAMHQFDRVVEALRSYDRPPVQLVIAGGGIGRARWMPVAIAEPSLSIHFVDFQRGAAFAAMMGSASAALVTLTPGMERLAVPSKTWSALSAGRPIVAHMVPESDVGRLVAETGAGWLAPDVDGLRDAFDALNRKDEVRAAGSAARKVYEERFTASSVTAAYAALIIDLLAAA